MADLASARRDVRLSPIHLVTHAFMLDRLTLLLADTDSSSSSASGLRVLTSNSQTPVVSQTPMSSDLLQSFQILTKLALHTVGQNLSVLAIDDISLSVEEPRWNLVLCWVLNDRDDALQFFGCNFTSSVLY